MNEPQQVTTPKARETERGCAFIWENDVRLEFYWGGTGASCPGRQRPWTEEMQLVTKLLLWKRQQGGNYVAFFLPEVLHPLLGPPVGLET